MRSVGCQAIQITTTTGRVFAVLVWVIVMLLMQRVVMVDTTMMVHVMMRQMRVSVEIGGWTVAGCCGRGISRHCSLLCIVHFERRWISLVNLMLNLVVVNAVSLFLALLCVTMMMMVIMMVVVVPLLVHAAVVDTTSDRQRQRRGAQISVGGTR